MAVLHKLYKLTSTSLHGIYLRRLVNSLMMGIASSGDEQQNAAIVDTKFLRYVERDPIVGICITE